MATLGIDMAGTTDLDEVTPPGIRALPGVHDGTEIIIGTCDDKTWKREPRKRKRVESFGG